jgi:quinol monooxygenase YgiN
MPEPILYIDLSDIRPGKLETVKALMTDLVAFVEANEPQLIAYDFYIDETDNTMTCVALHPDSASMEFHMDIGWERFRAFSEHIDQRSIDVYGEANENVMARLQGKIEMLGKGRVTAHRLHAGFGRRSLRAGTDEARPGRLT